MRSSRVVSTAVAGIVALWTIHGHAAAGLMLRQRIVFASATDPPREQVQYYTDSVRITDDERFRSIADLNKRTLTIINKPDHTYSVATFDELAKQTDTHDQRAKKAPPPVREMIHAGEKVDLKATGKKEKIAGYETTEYSVNAKAIAGSVWVAEKLDLGARDAEWLKINELFGGRSTPGGQLDEALSKIKGVPLRRQITMEPLPLVVTEVTEVKVTAPPADLLTVPTGYQKVDPPRPKKLALPKPSK